MKKNGILILFLFSIGPAHALNLDNEVCAIYQSGSCGSGTEMFFIHMREGDNSTNRDRCSRLSAICKTADIDTWIAMYRESGAGRRGYRTSYSFSSAQVDQNGVLQDLKGKSFVRCFKKRRHADWEQQAIVTCGAPAEQACSNGKVLVDGVCKSPTAVFDTDNSNSVHGYQVSQGLLHLAAAHNNGSSQIVVNPDQTGIDGNHIPGENGNTTGVELGNTNGSGSSGSNPSAIANSYAGSGGGMSVESSSEALRKANAALAALNGPVNMNAEAGSAGEKVYGADGNSVQRQQGQSITNPDIVAGNGGGPGADSLDVKSRTLASLAVGKSAGKSSEDPADYFTRIGLDASLFKVVTTRLRQEQAGWILEDRPSRPIRGAGSAR